MSNSQHEWCSFNPAQADTNKSSPFFGCSRAMKTSRLFSSARLESDSPPGPPGGGNSIKIFQPDAIGGHHDGSREALPPDLVRLFVRQRPPEPALAHVPVFKQQLDTSRFFQRERVESKVQTCPAGDKPKVCDVKRARLPIAQLGYT